MGYKFLLKKNNAQSTISGNVLGGDTSILVTSLVSFPEVGLGSFLCTIWNSTTYPDPSNDPNMEIVKVTSISSGNTFTVIRGQENTLARTHAIGSAIQMLLTVGQLSEYENQINNYLYYSLFTSMMSNAGGM